MIHTIPGIIQRNLPMITDQENSGSNNSSNETTSSDDPYDTEGHEIPQTYIEIKNPDYREKTIKVESGGNRVVMAGADYWFSATAYGYTGGVLKKPEFKWNFGDGSIGRGQPEVHRFREPGTYLANVTAISSPNMARDYFSVTVIPPSLQITEASTTAGYVTIENSAAYNIEISGYGIRSGRDEFIFPEASYIGKTSQLKLSNAISDLEPSPDKRLRIVYPNGKTLDEYVWPKTADEARGPEDQETLESPSTSQTNRGHSDPVPTLLVTEKKIGGPIQLSAARSAEPDGAASETKATEEAEAGAARAATASASTSHPTPHTSEDSTTTSITRPHHPPSYELYLLGLGISLAFVAALYVFRPKNPPTESSKLADSIEIID